MELRNYKQPFPINRTHETCRLTSQCPTFIMPHVCLQGPYKPPLFNPRQLMMKLSRDHDLLQWCSHATSVLDLQTGNCVLFVYFLMRATWFTLWCCVVGVSVKTKSSILLALYPLLLPCCLFFLWFVFGWRAIRWVTLPHHRPRNVRPCCRLSPSFLSGHYQRDGIKIRMQQRSWWDNIQFI